MLEIPNNRLKYDARVHGIQKFRPVARQNDLNISKQKQRFCPQQACSGTLWTAPENEFRAHAFDGYVNDSVDRLKI